MASNIFLASSQTGSAINYYLSGAAGQQYTGSGTPWTAQSTSPYRLAMNDVTGQRWSLRAAEAGVVFGGGAPFALGGGAALYTANGDVVETIPIQVYANTLDRAIFLVRQLQHILSGPANGKWSVLLGVQPDTTSNVVYYEVKGGTVQETPHFVNDELGRKMIRANITLTRAPYGGASSLATVFNGATFTNVGTGSNNNTQSMGISALSVSSTEGDRTIPGQLVNIKIANGSSLNAHRVYLATVLDRIYTSVNVAKTTTTSADWALSAGNVTLNAAQYYNPTLKGRLLARFTTFTALDKAVFKVTVYDSLGSANGSILLGPKSIVYTENTSASTAFIDFGWFDLSFLRRNQLGTTAPKITVNFVLLSSDGTSVSATLDYFEVLQYWDFCRIDPPTAMEASSSAHMYIEQLNNLNQIAYIPSRPALPYFTTTSNDQPYGPCVVRGRLPRARVGASLYVSWLDTTFVHTKTETATITVQSERAYHTYRGAG